MDDLEDVEVLKAAALATIKNRRLEKEIVELREAALKSQRAKASSLEASAASSFISINNCEGNKPAPSADTRSSGHEDESNSYQELSKESVPSKFRRHLSESESDDASEVSLLEADEPSSMSSSSSDEEPAGHTIENGDAPLEQVTEVPVPLILDDAADLNEFDEDDLVTEEDLEPSLPPTANSITPGSDIHEKAFKPVLVQFRDKSDKVRKRSYRNRECERSTKTVSEAAETSAKEGAHSRANHRDRGSDYENNGRRHKSTGAGFGRTTHKGERSPSRTHSHSGDRPPHDRTRHSVTTERTDRAKRIHRSQREGRDKTGNRESPVTLTHYDRSVPKAVKSGIDDYPPCDRLSTKALKGKRNGGTVYGVDKTVTDNEKKTAKVNIAMRLGSKVPEQELRQQKRESRSKSLETTKDTDQESRPHVYQTDTELVAKKPSLQERLGKYTGEMARSEEQRQKRKVTVDDDNSPEIKRPLSSLVVPQELSERTDKKREKSRSRKEDKTSVRLGVKESDHYTDLLVPSAHLVAADAGPGIRNDFEQVLDDKIRKIQENNARLLARQKEIEHEKLLFG